MTVRRRWILAINSGFLVVLSAVAAALINQLGGGWGWWAGAGSVVLVWAVATGVTAFRTSEPASRISVAEGGIYAGGNMRRGVTTRTTIVGSAHAVEPSRGEGIHIGQGAAFAAGDIEGAVLSETTVYGDSDKPRNGSAS